MKSTILTAAIALTIAGPSFAAQVTDARAHFAQSEVGGNGARVHGPVSGSAETTAKAHAHFAADDHGDGAHARFIVSTSGADIVATAKAKLSNGERGDN